MLLLGIIVGLIILTVVVVLHELGHAMVAKRNGVVVEEFGIGFPPRAKGWKVKKSFLGKNVEYTLNWLPLGGFVKMQGEHDADAKKGDYGKATFWQKSKILLAGVAMNWLTAVVLLTILALFGIPKVIVPTPGQDNPLLMNQFTVPSDTVSTKSAVQVYVNNDSPAAKAGLQDGDKVLSLDGEAIDSPNELSELTKTHAGEVVKVQYQRDDTETRTIDVQLNDAAAAKESGYLGVSPIQRETLRATWSAPIVGVGLTAQLTALTFQGLGSTFMNFVTGLAEKVSPNQTTRDAGSEKLTEAGQNVAGPVGLLGSIVPGVLESGLSFVILLVAIISISLAVINVLPIPALDGGRWFVTALFKLMKKPLKPETEERIHGTGFMILMGLFVLITIADIGKFL